MVTFVQKLWVEYPIPKDVSVWGPVMDNTSEETTVLEDPLSVLIESCVDELQSDILITESLEARQIATPMPEGTIGIISTRLSQRFQGNSFVKSTYVAASNTLMLRYYPAIVLYQRRLRVSDLDTLKGDRLIYAKMYILAKMAVKELVEITSIKLEADNGGVNTDTLSAFAENCQKRYDAMKPEILIYNHG